MTMDKDTIVKWLTDYTTYWAQLPAPEDFLTWDSLGQTIDQKLADFNTFLSGISDDQLKGLATYMDNGTPANDNVSPPIPAAPPQPYIIKQLAVCLVSGSVWIAQRLNNLLPTAGIEAGTLNWLFQEFQNYTTYCRSWALSKQLKTIVSFLDTWAHGSDADLKTQYPDSTNLHSIDTLWNIMKLSTMLDDDSAKNKIADPTPAYMASMTNTIIASEAY